MIDPLVFEWWKSIDFWGIKPRGYRISNFGRVYSNLKNGLLSPAILNGSMFHVIIKFYQKFQENK